MIRLSKIKLKQDFVNLHCDSQSALHLATNQMMNSKIEHINISYHFMCDKRLELIKFDDKFNLVDVLIKAIYFKKINDILILLRISRKSNSRVYMQFLLPFIFFIYPILTMI